MTTVRRIILVTGATGHVGRHVVTQLLEAGVGVRALTRTPTTARLPDFVDTREGNFDNVPEGLFTDVEATFVFPAPGAEGFVRRAAAAGVPRLVLMSSLAAAQEHARDQGSASQTFHSSIEEAVRDSGTDWSIIRPGTFATNLLSWSQPIQYTGGVSGPYAKSSQAPVHEADIAAVAAVLLQELEGGEQSGKTIALTGPEALTRIEQLAAIGAAIGRGLVFTENSPTEFRAEMKQYGVSDDIVKMLLNYWRETVDTPDVVRSVQWLTGRPQRTLRQWAHDHAAAFSVSAPSQA